MELFHGLGVDEHDVELGGGADVHGGQDVVGEGRELGGVDDGGGLVDDLSGHAGSSPQIMI